MDATSSLQMSYAGGVAASAPKHRADAPVSFGAPIAAILLPLGGASLSSSMQAVVSRDLFTRGSESHVRILEGFETVFRIAAQNVRASLGASTAISAAAGKTTEATADAHHTPADIKAMTATLDAIYSKTESEQAYFAAAERGLASRHSYYLAEKAAREGGHPTMNDDEFAALEKPFLADKRYIESQQKLLAAIADEVTSLAAHLPAIKA